MEFTGLNRKQWISKEFNSAEHACMNTFSPIIEFVKQLHMDVIFMIIATISMVVKKQIVFRHAITNYSHQSCGGTDIKSR